MKSQIHEPRNILKKVVSNKIIMSVSLSLAAIAAFAQQDAQFTQNPLLKLPVNPGFAGTNDMLCITSAYRTQWMGFPGAPKTFLVTADMPVLSVRGGLGLTIMKDKLGNFNFTMARAAYSYHQMLQGGAAVIGWGLEAGVMQSSIALNWLTPSGTSGSEDNSVPTDFISRATYDIGAGAFYKSGGTYVGFSVSHIPGKAEHLSGPPKFNYKAANHYYLMAGYKMRLNGPLALLPSFHAKSDGTVATFDLNCNLLYNDMFWGGLSYRLQDAIAPTIGVSFRPAGSKSPNVLTIGYSYDLGLSNMKNHHDNTHEIVVKYCLDWASYSNTTHISPRDMRGKQVY